MPTNEKNSFELREEDQILYFWNEKRCREIAAQFQIGKIAVSSMLRDDKKLCKEFEVFKDNCELKRVGQFSLINETGCMENVVL